MTAQLGVNVAATRLDVADALATGATWVRLVLLPDPALRQVALGYHLKGLKVLGVLARESFEGVADRAQQAGLYANRYGDVVSGYSLGNEPDLTSPSSWTMQPGEYAALVRAVAPPLRATGKPVLTAGLASGNSQYLDACGADVWTLCTGVAIHPYGKDTPTVPAPTGNFGQIGPLLTSYARFGRPLWITEYGTDTPDEGKAATYIGAMTRVLRTDPRVAVAIHFCLNDVMVEPFGLIDTHGRRKPAFDAFKREAAVAEKTYVIGQGVKDAMRQYADEPKGDETYFPDGQTSIAPGRDRLYFYSKASNQVYAAPKA